MTFAMLLGPTLRRFGDVGAQLLRERAVVIGTDAELFAVRRDFALDARRAHALLLVRLSKCPALLLAAAAVVGKALLERSPTHEESVPGPRRIRARARGVQVEQQQFCSATGRRNGIG